MEIAMGPEIDTVTEKYIQLQKGSCILIRPPRLPPWKIIRVKVCTS